MALRVLSITPELGPISGGGRSARAVYDLCRALAREGADVTAVVPQYAEVAPNRFGLARRLEPLAVPWGAGEFEMEIHEGLMPDGRARVFTVALPPHLELESPPRPDRPGNDPRPMAAFCRAALQLAAERSLWPDVVQAYFGTELSLLLSQASVPAGEQPPGTVLRIQAHTGHAVLHQQDLQILGVAEFAAARGFRPDDPPSARSMLAVGVEFADRVVVPSRDLAASRELIELCGSPERLRPVLDGAEARTAVVARDPEAKLALQRDVGLPPRPRTPLIAVTSPLSPALLSGDALAALVDTDAQFLFVAREQRDGAALTALRSVAARTTRVALRVVPDGDYETAEQAALAGADLALLTAPFPLEGGNPLGVIHAGVLPIAPAAGGYADALVEIDPRTATGSGFLYQADNPVELVAATRRAVRAYRQSDLDRVAARVAELDLSWRTAARRYLEIYGELD